MERYRILEGEHKGKIVKLEWYMALAATILGKTRINGKWVVLPYYAVCRASKKEYLIYKLSNLWKQLLFFWRQT